VLNCQETIDVAVRDVEDIGWLLVSHTISKVLHWADTL
jgi:hypothetical protein